MPAAKISSNSVLRALHEKKALPVFPAIITKLDVALSESTINIDKVVAIIAADMTIAARVMRVASAARYGVKPPHDLLEAVSRLGFAEVRAVAFAAAYTTSFMRPKHIDVKTFWRHAFVSAVAAREFAVWYAKSRQNRLCDTATAFLLGLSHEVGMLLLDLFSPESYAEVVEAVKAEDQNFAEQQILGTTHAVIGGALFKYWGFPDHMAMAVAAHHFPLRIQPELQPMADLVCFSEVIAYKMGYGNSLTIAVSDTMEHVYAQRSALYGLDDWSLAALQKTIEEKLIEEDWLSLADSLA